MKYCNRSRVSSGSIVSDYWLDDRAIGVGSPAGAKDFSSSLCVQTGSGAHPASCPMGTGGLFPGAKRGRGVTLTTHPHLVLGSWMSRSYTSSHPSASKACSGTALMKYCNIPIFTTLLPRIREIPGWNLGSETGCTDREFSWFFLSLCRQIPGSYIKITSRPLPSTSFPIYYSPIISVIRRYIVWFTERVSLKDYKQTNQQKIS
jgi:hypothetical protein